LLRPVNCDIFIVLKLSGMATIIKKKSKRKEISKLFNKVISSKGVNTKKYCGVIKLTKDPLIIQKELRDEWE